MQYNFEWDTVKAKSNFQKHNISFERASEIFLDPYVVLQKEKMNNITQGEKMKKEYDFSKGVRGKFYHENIRLNLPIYLDKDIADFVLKYAKQKKVDSQTVVNTILRATKK